MRLGPQRSATLAAMAFLLVFPGFVFYQTAVDAGRIQPALGGFFTASCAVAMPFLAFAYLRNVRHFRIGAIGGLFFAFLGLFGLNILAGALTGANSEITGSHAAYLFKFVVLFLAARLIDSTRPRFVQWTAVAFLSVVVVILSRVLEGDLLVIRLARQANEDFMLDYQGVGHALLVLSLFCAPPLKRRYRFGVYVLAAPALFLTGARSELVAFLLAAGLIEFCKTRQRLPFLLAAVALVGIASLALEFVTLPDHRIFNLLRISEDQSVHERARMAVAAWDTIENSPLLGSYASYPPGTYAHNILSAWVDLGLAGFLLLIVLLVAPTFVLLRRFARWRRDDLYVLALVCFAVTILLVLFAKTFTYQTIPLALGLYCRWRFPPKVQEARHAVRSQKYTTTTT